MTIGRRELSVAVLAIAALVFYLVFLSTTPSGAQTDDGFDDDTPSQLDDEDCSNPVQVATFDDTEDQTTEDEFEITGDSFRVTYDVNETDADDTGSFSIDVLDEGGGQIDSVSLSGGDDANGDDANGDDANGDDANGDDDTGSINIPEGPGTFSLDINADGFDYLVTVDDCEGTDDDGDDNDINGDDDNDDDLFNDEDIDDDGEITINNNGNNQNRQRTGQIINVPNKPLPPTGGLPTYAMVAGSVFAGAGLLSLGIAIRRGRR